MTRYWSSRTVTETSILSWFHEETKFNRDIKEYKKTLGYQEKINVYIEILQVKTTILGINI